MTNEEKQAFEKQRRNAERQLNDMYYGNQKKSGEKPPLKMPPFLNSNTPSQKPPLKKQMPETPAPPEPKRLGILEMLNFKALSMDSDRTTILALCLLLSEEKADELLLLALIYIML